MHLAFGRNYMQKQVSRIKQTILFKNNKKSKKRMTTYIYYIIGNYKKGEYNLQIFITIQN